MGKSHTKEQSVKPAVNVVEANISRDAPGPQTSTSKETPQSQNNNKVKFCWLLVTICLFASSIYTLTIQLLMGDEDRKKIHHIGIYLTISCLTSGILSTSKSNYISYNYIIYF
jgi:hypothetical protein